MRANLAGERILVIGQSRDHPMPAIACAWRVDDPDQARVDQDHFMDGVCCGLARNAEAPRSDQSAKPAETPEATAAASTDPTVEARRCEDFGPFVDRFLGRTFKLGASSLSWRTVTTPCGGWQLYASDPRWLLEVEERLAASSCSDDERPQVAGVGFCDGPRAAALLRRWQPLATPGAQDRVSKGLIAISDMMERLGRVRFRYEMPSAQVLRATLDVEPASRLGESPQRPRVPTTDRTR
jgi:hypothetical protein